MMTRNSKRKLQEEESQNESKSSTKSVRVDHEITSQLANIDKLDSNGTKISGRNTEDNVATKGNGNCENLQDNSIKFEDFPAEILLKMLNFLKINELLKCSQTSKRIRVICYDDSLWQTIDLSKKKVPAEFLQKVITYGCKSLNLNETKLVGTLRLENESQLTNLDLSGCTASRRVFEELLKSCHYLQKLTFTQPLNFVTLSTLTSQNGKTLQVLNCWWKYQSRANGCKKLDLPSIQSIIENCTELRELNFWNGVLSKEVFYNQAWLQLIYPGNVDYLVNNISANIEKFSVCDSLFNDEHIKILVSRCTKIKVLRFAGLWITNDSLTHIIDHLSPTLEQLELTEINIGYKKMFQLKLMPKLKTLDDLSGYKWEIIHELREQLPDVSVNGYPPMATVCRKKKVKYDKYFYNDLWMEQCSMCNAEFVEMKDLDEHVSKVHDGKNSCKCDMCESTFARINELNQHNNNVHGKYTATQHCQCCNED